MIIIVDLCVFNRKFDFHFGIEFISDKFIYVITKLLTIAKGHVSGGGDVSVVMEVS